VFGTFAFRQAQLSPAPHVSGKVLDKGGNPVPNSVVTLANNQVQVRPQTNSTGDFAFRWSTIANGATLQVAFSGAPLSGLEIKPQ
jgi:hypothetical protein